MLRQLYGKHTTQLPILPCFLFPYSSSSSSVDNLDLFSFFFRHNSARTHFAFHLQTFRPAFSHTPAEQGPRRGTTQHQPKDVIDHVSSFHEALPLQPFRPETRRQATAYEATSGADGGGCLVMKCRDGQWLDESERLQRRRAQDGRRLKQSCFNSWTRVIGGGCRPD